MKNKKIMSILAVVMLSAIVLGGCGKSGREESNVLNTVADEVVQTNQGDTDIQDSEVTQNATVENLTSEDNTNVGTAAGNTDVSSELKVTFGDVGDSFSMHLYDDNETAAAIAEYVGSSGWRLPIYEYDDDVNYDVMQYYDIPNRYEIPSNPQQITAAKTGEVYYSDPNRVILFYGDAEISGEYTLIGYFDPTEEFVGAVRGNPTLEGWENKIIQIDQP